MIKEVENKENQKISLHNFGNTTTNSVAPSNEIAQTLRDVTAIMEKKKSKQIYDASILLVRLTRKGIIQCHKDKT
jgi:hypothetical protein